MLIHLLIDCQLVNCFLVHNPSHTDTSTYSLNLHSLQLRITLTRSFCLSPVLLNLPIMLVSRANLFIFRPFIKLDCPSTFVWKCAHTHHISLSVAVSFHFSARRVRNAVDKRVFCLKHWLRANKHQVCAAWLS